MAISSLPTMIMILDKVLSFEPTYKCAMHNMTTIKAFRLFFLSFTAFPFLSFPDLRKQIRIAQAGQSNVTTQDLKWL